MPRGPDSGLCLASALRTRRSSRACYVGARAKRRKPQLWARPSSQQGMRVSSAARRIEVGRRVLGNGGQLSAGEARRISDKRASKPSSRRRRRSSGGRRRRRSGRAQRRRPQRNWPRAGLFATLRAEEKRAIASLRAEERARQKDAGSGGIWGGQ